MLEQQFFRHYYAIMTQLCDSQEKQKLMEQCHNPLKGEKIYIYLKIVPASHNNILQLEGPTD